MLPVQPTGQRSAPPLTPIGNITLPDGTVRGIYLKGPPQQPLTREKKEACTQIFQNMSQEGELTPVTAIDHRGFHDHTRQPYGHTCTTALQWRQFEEIVSGRKSTPPGTSHPRGPFLHVQATITPTAPIPPPHHLPPPRTPQPHRKETQAERETRLHQERQQTAPPSSSSQPSSTTSLSTNPPQVNASLQPPSTTTRNNSPRRSSASTEETPQQQVHQTHRGIDGGLFNDLLKWIRDL